MNPRTQGDYPPGAYPQKDRSSESKRQTIERSDRKGSALPAFPTPDAPATERGNRSGTKGKSEAQPMASFKSKGKFSR